MPPDASLVGQATPIMTRFPSKALSEATRAAKTAAPDLQRYYSLQDLPGAESRAGFPHFLDFYLLKSLARGWASKCKLLAETTATPDPQSETRGISWVRPKRILTSMRNIPLR